MVVGYPPEYLRHLQHIHWRHPYLLPHLDDGGYLPVPQSPHLIDLHASLPDLLVQPVTCNHLLLEPHYHPHQWDLQLNNQPEHMTPPVMLRVGQWPMVARCLTKLSDKQTEP